MRSLPPTWANRHTGTGRAAFMAISAGEGSRSGRAVVLSHGRRHGRWRFSSPRTRRLGRRGRRTGVAATWRRNASRRGSARELGAALGLRRPSASAAAVAATFRRGAPAATAFGSPRGAPRGELQLQRRPRTHARRALKIEPKWIRMRIRQHSHAPTARQRCARVCVRVHR